MLIRISTRWGRRLTTCSKLEYPDFAKKETALDFAKKETVVDFAKKLAVIDIAEETPVDFAKKETAVAVAKKEAAVDFVKVEKKEVDAVDVEVKVDNFESTNL